MLICLSCSWGCQFDPFTPEYPRSRPAQLALEGLYTLDSGSREFLAARGTYKSTEASFQLERSGALSFRDLPDCWLDLGEIGEGKLLTGTGTWRLERSQAWWQLRVDIEWEVAGTNSALAQNGVSALIMLLGQQEPYELHLTLGDPDAGEGLRFVRRAVPAEPLGTVSAARSQGTAVRR